MFLFLAWWSHKTVNKWILPSIIKCLSKIDPADWDICDASNNLNEGQHHRTNLDTGIKLTITEAIETLVELSSSVFIVS